MKLQINTTGAWRDVIRYDERDDSIVRQSAATVASLSDPKPAKLRLLGESGEVTGYWDAFKGWKNPEHSTCG